MDSINEEALSDADLIAEVRNGNDEASGELFRRHHDAALAFGVRLAGATLAPDLVSDAFTKLFAILRRGDGPDVSFRPYLLTTVRRTHIDHLRRTRREVPVDMVEDFAGGQAGLVFVDDPDARFETNAVLRAFRSLPERWQTALWLAVVEKEPLERVAQHLGMNANSVAALSFRAREGLRRAYLAEHLGRAEDPDCRATLELLAQRVRGQLPRRRDQQVAAHLDGCRVCTGALVELESINTNLGAVLAPAVLGGGLSADALAGFGAGGASRAHRWGRALGVAGATALTVLLGVWWMASGNPAQSPESVSNEVPSSGAPSATATPSGHSVGDREEEKPEPSVTPPSRTPSATMTVPAEPTSEPTESVTVTPLPQPTRTPEATPVPEPPVRDVALGEGSQHQLTFVDPIWVHLEIPVVSRGAELNMSVRLTDVAGHHVHADRDYGNWRCAEKAFAGKVRTLVCHMTPEAERSDDFGLDLRLDADSSASVAARVRPAEGEDRQPANNVAHLTVSVSGDPSTSPRRAAGPSGQSVS
jgi:RNA polymerase sigma factor (sigma-70 family)